MAAGGLRILCVDDLRENLLALEAVLRNEGYEIVTASSGRDALRWLLTNDCAAIVLDANMPGMDGFETAQLIRKDARHADAPILFVTAQGFDESDVERAYQVGAVDYIIKPFSPTLLRLKVANLAALRRARDRVLEQERLLREHEREAQRRTLAELELKFLRREESLLRRYQQVVDELQDAIVWTAEPLTLALTFVSPGGRRITGRTIDIEQRDAWKALVHPDDHAIFLQQVKALAFEQPLVVEHRLLTVDGDTVWMRTALVRETRTGSVGEDLHALSVDITATKVEQETLHHAISQRDDFISVASHELRTPLTPLRLGLRSTMQWIEGQPPESVPPAILRTLRIADRQVDQLGALIDNLLDLTRIRSGQLDLKVEPFDLAGLVRDVLARFEPELQRRKINVSSRLDAAAGRWDRPRLDQVVTNLVSNALKYGDGKPVDVTLACDAAAAEARLAVVDRGRGIAPADRELIFERFERVGGGGGDGGAKVQGLGLGLFITRQIVVAHGGDIGVESAPGEGARFTVRLPLLPPQA